MCAHFCLAVSARAFQFTPSIAGSLYLSDAHSCVKACLYSTPAVNMQCTHVVRVRPAQCQRGRLQILIAFYEKRPAEIQLGLASEHTEQRHRRNAAILALVPALVICPLFPLAVIWLWNAIMPRRPARRGRVDGIIESGSGTVVKGGAQHAADDKLGLDRIIITCDNGVASIRYASGKKCNRGGGGGYCGAH